MTKFINNFIPFSLKANEHFGYSCIALSKIAKASSYFLSFTEHAPFKIDSIFIFFNYIFYQSYYSEAPDFNVNFQFDSFQKVWLNFWLFFIF